MDICKIHVLVGNWTLCGRGTFASSKSAISLNELARRVVDKTYIGGKYCQSCLHSKQTRGILERER